MVGDTVTCTYTYVCRKMVALSKSYTVWGGELSGFHRGMKATSTHTDLHSNNNNSWAITVEELQD